MARQFSRDQFHALVWSKPMTHLAREFGLSDVALHKICRKHSIPTPPLGWWAKQQAGKPVRRTPLPVLEVGATDRIVIAAPELRGETPAVASVREEARVRASDGVFDDEERSFPIVDRTIAALRAAAPSDKGLVVSSGADVISCEVAPGSLSRVETVLRRIATAATHQGFVMEAGARGACLVGSGETIGFRLSEEVKRIRHVLTPAEQKQEDAWRRKSERRWNSNSWDDEFELRPRFADWDYVSTGRLGFEMDKVYVERGRGPRSTFRDAKVQRLDDMADDIAVALVVLATAKREERERRAEAERLRLEAKRERERPLREKHVEERRRHELDGLLEDIEALERFRALHGRLAALAASDDTPRVAEFLEWAASELAARERAFSPRSLEARFAGLRIFGEDDDHSFQSPHWY